MSIQKTDTENKQSQFSTSHVMCICMKFLEHQRNCLVIHWSSRIIQLADSLTPIWKKEQLAKRQQSFSWPFYPTLGRWNFTQSIDTTSICWLHKSLHSCTHNLYNNGECLCKAQGIRTTQSTTKSIISSQAM